MRFTKYEQKQALSRYLAYNSDLTKNETKVSFLLHSLPTDWLINILTRAPVLLNPPVVVEFGDCTPIVCLFLFFLLTVLMRWL